MTQKDNLSSGIGYTVFDEPDEETKLRLRLLNAEFAVIAAAKAWDDITIETDEDKSDEICTALANAVARLRDLEKCP